MRRRQTEPLRWLIVNRPFDPSFWKLLRKLPEKSGILLLREITPSEQRRLLHIARLGGHRIAGEIRGGSARIHSAHELTRALVRRPERILLSPMYDTRTHPEWRPMPRMRAAALARLCGRRAIALGGMNDERYRSLAPLGFTGWAGITAFRT